MYNLYWKKSQMLCCNISITTTRVHWVYMGSDITNRSLHEMQPPLAGPAAVHFLMRFSVHTVNTVIWSRCTAEKQWMLLKCNKWLLCWWLDRFGEIAIIMNELTQFINQKKAQTCGSTSTQLGYSLCFICVYLIKSIGNNNYCLKVTDQVPFFVLSQMIQHV